MGGTYEQRTEYFCKTHQWTGGVKFYTSYALKPQKPEIFTAAHIDIDKKWIIEHLTIQFDNILTKNPDQKL